MANKMDTEKVLAKILADIEQSKGSKNDYIEQWEDERKCYLGNQWELSFMGSTRKDKQLRPNSVDNFIYPTIEFKRYILTTNTPDQYITLMSTQKKEENTDIYMQNKLASEIMTKCVDSIMYKNKYPLIWDKIILQGLMHGPLISMVSFDGDWKGGVGENRWVGEVNISFIDVRDFLPDPAITDLETNMQDAEFICIRQRKKNKWFKDKYGIDISKKVSVNLLEDDTRDEGQIETMSNLYIYFHKGTPKEVTKEWKDIWEAKLENADPDDALRYEEMIKGKAEGVHAILCTDGHMLEYIPYVYEDGLYPIAYKVIHIDPDSQWGFGEIKNMIMPQVLHNKADEIEIEAYSKQGLGGIVFNKNAVTEKQKRIMAENMYRGGAILEVNDVNGIKPRYQVQTPQSLIAYKQGKEVLAYSIGGYTPIQQGVAKAGTPFKAIQELGARADVRTIGIIKKAELFHREIVELIISRVKQFYKDKRVFKSYMNEEPELITYNPDLIYDTWERELEDGSTVKEKYLPEYEIRVSISDAKPNDRDYYINLANMLFERGLVDEESYLDTIETGKLPNINIIKTRLEQLKQQLQQQMPEQQMPEQQIPQIPQQGLI